MLPVTNSSRRSRRFFNSISTCYQDLIKGSVPPKSTRAIIEPRMGGRVLDVGNGGVRRFFSPGTFFYVGVDSSLEMLKKGEDKGIEKICGEATLLPLREGVFDTVFYRHLLHHLADRNPERTIEIVKTVLHQGLACLEKKGNVIIVEPCLPLFLEKIERAFFFILRAFYFLTKQSDIFLFSAESLTRSLEEIGFREIEVWQSSDDEQNPWEWTRAFIGLPFLRIPKWVNPGRRTIFEARR